MILSRFSVLVEGIGRKDYSSAIEVSTESSLRGHQRRYGVTYVGELPTLPFGDFYAVGFLFPDDTFLAPDTPFHLYKMTISTERNALVIVGLYRFNSMADFMIWNPDKWYGEIYGYGKAELLYTNSIKTEEGKMYTVPICEYTDQPTFTVHMECHALEEEIVYG